MSDGMHDADKGTAYMLGVGAASLAAPVAKEAAKAVWLEAMTERAETAKVLQRQRQNYINTKLEYERACRREDYLYAKWSQESPNTKDQP